MDKPIKILFMQSQTYFGADSRIHALLMEHLDRGKFEVHVAIDEGRGNRSASFNFISKIPGIHFKPTNFGPSINGLSKIDAMKQILVGTPLFNSQFTQPGNLYPPV